MDKIKSRFNSFSGKITLIVMLGISLIAVTVSFVVLVMSRQVFTKNYRLNMNFRSCGNERFTGSGQRYGMCEN